MSKERWNLWRKKGPHYKAWVGDGGGRRRPVQKQPKVKGGEREIAREGGHVNTSFCRWSTGGWQVGGARPSSMSRQRGAGIQAKGAREDQNGQGKEGREAFRFRTNADEQGDERRGHRDGRGGVEKEHDH